MLELKLTSHPLPEAFVPIVHFKDLAIIKINVAKSLIWIERQLLVDIVIKHQTEITRQIRE